MAKGTYIIYLILLVGYLPVSAQPTHLLHKPFSAKYCYVDSIRNVLSSGSEKVSMQDIQSSIDWAKSKNEGDLATLLQLLRYKLLADLPGMRDSLEQQTTRLLATYGKTSDYVNAEILQKLGFFYYFALNKNSLSFERYVQAYDQYKDMDPRDFPGKRTNIYELSGSYYRLGDYHSAIKYLKEALGTPQTGCGDDLVSTCYNTIGLSYQAMRNYDSALIYYKLGKELALSRKDSRWIGISDGNIGSIYFLQANYDEAIPALQTSIELGLIEKQRRNALNSICTLAEAYLKLKDNINAERCLQKADSILRSFGFLRSFELTSQLSRLKAKLYAAKGDAHLTWLYADSAIIAADSVNAALLISNQLKTADREQFVKQKFDLQRIEAERQRQILLRNSLIISIIFLMIIAVLIINRQRLVHKKLDAEKRSAESELAVATTKLFSFRQRETEKDELIEQLKKEEEEQEDLQARIQLENAILLTDEQWDNFRRQFEKVHPGFFTSLKNNIPDLTPAEVRFLALTKLKLTPKEMTAMLGVSLNAIRVYRYRLRKRLNLDKDQTIEEMVEKM